MLVKVDDSEVIPEAVGVHFVRVVDDIIVGVYGFIFSVFVKNKIVSSGIITL